MSHFTSKGLKVHPILVGKQKFQQGSNRYKAGKVLLNSNLAGKHISLAVRPFTLAGQRFFSGIVTGGVLKTDEDCKERDLQ